MALRLINARPSPYGRKVVIALREKGLDYALQYDVPWGDRTCTRDYSPLQQLSILITERDENVYDSAYIFDWLELHYLQPALLPAGIDARLTAHQRRLLGERLMEAGQALIFEMIRPDPSGPQIERQTRKVMGMLAELERLCAAQGAARGRGTAGQMFPNPVIGRSCEAAPSPAPLKRCLDNAAEFHASP